MVYLGPFDTGMPHPTSSASKCISPCSVLQNAQLPGQCDETNTHASCVFLYSCWLNRETGFIWSFLGPVCMIIMVRKKCVQVHFGHQGKPKLRSVITLQSLLLSKLIWFLVLEISPRWLWFLCLSLFNHAQVQKHLEGTTALLVHALCFRGEIDPSVSSRSRCWMEDKVKRI